MMNTDKYSPFIDIKQIIKLRINGINKISRHGSYALEHKDFPRVRFSVRVLWDKVQIYQLNNLSELVQTLKIHRVSRSMQCPICEEWVKRVYFTSTNTCRGQYVCKTCVSKQLPTKKQKLR